MENENMSNYDVSIDEIATENMLVSDDIMVDAGNEVGTSAIMDGGIYTGGMDDYSGGMDTPKAGISTQVILYIVIGVCAIAGIALGIIRGIKVAKK